MNELQIDESVERMIQASNPSPPGSMEASGSKDNGEVNEDGEVWASEVDDDDVIYEGATSFEDITKDTDEVNYFDKGYGGRGYGGRDTKKLLSPQECQNRFGYLIRAFNSSFVNGVCPESWKEYGLVDDVCSIITHLSPPVSSVVTPPVTSVLLSRTKLEDGTSLGLPPWVDQGWVEYTYVLRDILTSDRPNQVTEPVALQFLLSQLDPYEGPHDDGASASFNESSSSESEDLLSPRRCVSLVVLHSVVKGQSNVVKAPSLRIGLLQRLQVLSDCIASVTEALTTILAAGSQTQVDDVVLPDGAPPSQRAEEPTEVIDQTETKALLYEQSKVLLVLIAFSIGIFLNSDSESEAKVLSPLPPASTLIRSQLLKNVTKHVCILAVKSNHTPTVQPNSSNQPLKPTVPLNKSTSPYTLGMQLLVIMLSHSAELTEFAIRAPSTVTLLEDTQQSPSLTVLLAISLALSNTSSSKGSTSSLGGTINDTARDKFQHMLDRVKETRPEPGSEGDSRHRFHDIVSILASFAHWNVVAIRRTQQWMNTPQGAWFRTCMVEAQKMITTETLITSKPFSKNETNPSNHTLETCKESIDTPTEGTGKNEKDFSNSDLKVREENEVDAPPPDQPGEMRGIQKRNVVSRSDAIKGAKLLLETTSGSSKTD
eukprot:CAMPEP_0114344134 /NCGR_PEP_ID=MMETSP0101-20121206/11180_1 /TAXON_ID=38822 ORGANISM="Pteridomonas danica, Strain PT" /NCGR_SAMPLE_ID=MMETSP0101 /ASSEMBLY_ACC=CAM_ASM_000211 /LENGTH=655 /DNA_ID=CAMNT_0001479307 /DNA_START=223 /DNA_END=2190 /DNA_ORIENTATION=-